MGEGLLWRRYGDELDEIQNRRTRRERARQTARAIRPDTVDRVGDLRASYGWVKPGALWSLAKAGVSPVDEVAKVVADTSAAVRNTKADWNNPGDEVGPGKFDPNDTPGTGGRGRMGVEMEPKPMEEEILSFKEFRNAIIESGQLEKRQTSTGTRVSTSEEREQIALGQEYADQWKNASKAERRAAYDSYVAEQTGNAPGGGGDPRQQRAKEIRAKDRDEFTEADKDFLRKIGREAVDKSTVGIGDLPDVAGDYLGRLGRAGAGTPGRDESPIAMEGAARAGEAISSIPGVGEPLNEAWSQTFARVKPVVRGVAVAANFPYEYAQASFRQLPGVGEGFTEGLRSNVGTYAEGGAVAQTEEILPQTVLGQVGKELLQGDRVDLGSGYLPGLDSDVVQAQAEAARRQGEIAGHAITPGRFLANMIFEPDTMAFDVLSGATDAAVAIYGDPTNFALKTTSAVRAGGKLITAADEGAEIQRALSGRNGRAYLDMLAGNTSVTDIAKRTGLDVSHPAVQRIAGSRTPEDVAHVLRSTPDLSSAQVIEATGGVDRFRKYRSPLTAKEALATEPFQNLNVKVAAESNPMKIRRMFGPSMRGQTPDGRNLWVELAEADNPGAVNQVWESVLGLGVREMPSMAAGREGVLARATHPFESIGYGFRRASKDTRLLHMTPGRTLTFDDLDDTVETAERTLINATVPEARRDEIIGNYMLGWRNKANREPTIRLMMDSIAEEMIHAGVPEDKARQMTRFIAAEEGTGRAFVTSQLSDGPATFDGLKVGDELVDFRYHPHDINETLNHGVQLPDPREIRKATSRFRPLFEHGIVEAGTAAADMYMGLWRTGKLARPAWGVRVIGEEQARIAAVGLDGIYTHPLSAISWMLANPKSAIADNLDRIDAWSRGGMKFGEAQRLTAGELDMLDELAEAGVGAAKKGPLGKAAGKVRGFRTKHARGMFLPDGTPFIDNETVQGALNRVGDIYRFHDDWKYLSHFNVIDRAHPNWNNLAARGLAEDYERLTSSVARKVMDAATPAEAKAWFWDDGPGARLRMQLSAQNNFAPLANNRAFSDAYIDSWFERVDQLTGSDARLRKAFRYGRVGGNPAVATDGVRLTDGYGQVTPDGERALKAILDEGVGPQRVKVQTRYLEDKTSLQRGKERLDAGLNSFMEAMMPRPSNFMDRGPTMNQYTWQRAEELLPYLKAEDRAKFFKHAEDSNLGKKRLAKMRQVKTVDGQPEKMLDLGQLSTASVAWAGDEVKRLLYDLSERSQFFDIFRIVFPFGEAWKEVATRWARISYEQPQVLRRAQQGIQGARGAGWFHKDPLSGQEVFSIPGTEWLTKNVAPSTIGGVGGAAVGLAAGGPRGAAIGAVGGFALGALTGGTEAAGVPVPMQAPVGGLSIVSTGLPGVGPAVQIPASFLLPNTPDWDWARNILYPFGEPEDTGSPFANVTTQLATGVLPNFAQKIFMASNNPDRFRIQGNTVGWTMRYLASTGDYKLNGDNAEAELRRLEADAVEKAKKVGWIRGMVASTAPSAPMPDWQVEDKDGTLVEAQVLVEEYRTLMEPESEGGQGLDFDEALEVFVDRHGLDNILITQSFSEPIRGFVPSTEKANDWVRENPKVADRFPEVFGLFAPGQNDDFSINAYSEQFTRGERKALTPREMLEQANNRIASNAYQRDVAALGDDANSGENREYLSDLRDWYSAQYPGFNKEAFDYAAVPNQIAELERAVRSPLLKGHAARDALKDYLKERRSMVADADGGSLGGDDDIEARQYLTDLANWWIEREPAFRPFWERVFSREAEV